MIWREIGLRKCQNDNNTLIVTKSRFYCKYFHLPTNLTIFITQVFSFKICNQNIQFL